MFLSRLLWWQVPRNRRPSGWFTFGTFTGKYDVEPGLGVVSRAGDWMERNQALVSPGGPSLAPMWGRSWRVRRSGARAFVPGLGFWIKSSESD